MTAPDSPDVLKARQALASAPWDTHMSSKGLIPLLQSDAKQDIVDKIASALDTLSIPYKRLVLREDRIKTPLRVKSEGRRALVEALESSPIKDRSLETRTLLGLAKALVPDDALLGR